MITYNLLEEILNKLINNKPSLESFCSNYISLINDNLVTNDTFENINEISEYESSNLGTDYYENIKNNYSCIHKEIEENKKIMKQIIDKKKKDIEKFINELKRIPIPKQPNEENQYRILSFPWCISGDILASIKYIIHNS